MAIITISRQFGCSGEYVGERVAKKLGYQFVNNEIIQFIAILTSTPTTVVRSFDEEYHSNITATLSKYIDLNMFTDIVRDDPFVKCETAECKILPEHTSLFEENYKSDPIFDSESFQKMVERIIIKLSQKDNVVIMGRGGQIILKDHPNTLHVKVYAPKEKRIEWIMNREKIDFKTAKKKIEEIDKRRADFIAHYYNSDINDINLYHLLINIHKFNIEQASEIITDTVKKHFKII